jgi:hypothetical protein
MGDAKFTPGPWDIDGKSIIGRKAAYVLQDFGPYEGVSWIDYGNVTPEECEANKALIAAAPDLYSILEAFASVGVQNVDIIAMLQVEAIKMLARARGETQEQTTAKPL